MSSLEKGLEGVLAAESELSRIDGDAGELSYRGYDIEDLAEGASFEEVAYLLWYGTLPDQRELQSFSESMAAERAVDDELFPVLRTLADADEDPMAVLRTTVSMLSAFDPDSNTLDALDERVQVQQARRITAKIPTIVAAFTRIRNGDEPVEPRRDLDHAANFLYMLNGEEPDEATADIFDTALILHADHGLNASTFSAIVTAATMTDLHSAVTSAIGTLKGPLHGGANQDVMEMLLEIDASDRDPDEWVENAIDEGKRIPGFGHRVYNVKDPRANILGRSSERLGREAGDTKWYEMSTSIESYVTDQKGIAPNVDFYSASMYYQMGIPTDIFTPIFTMSRVTGWTAHTFEYIDDNRLVRPRARYVGPKDQAFVPLEER